MRILIVASFSWASLTLAGCNPATESTSLVGVSKPPSLAFLKTETIIIGRGAGRDGEDTLNIEIHPNDDVLISAYRKGNRNVPAAKESLKLASGRSEGLRRMLWRLRPADRASAQNSIPIGCRYVYDAGSMWSVIFMHADDPENMAIFELPYPDYCKTPAYGEAKKLIEQVLGALPRSGVVRQFPAGRYRSLGTYRP